MSGPARFKSWDDFYGEVSPPPINCGREECGSKPAGSQSLRTGLPPARSCPSSAPPLDGLSQSPKVVQLDLDARCRALVEAIDGMMRGLEP